MKIIIVELVIDLYWHMELSKRCNAMQNHVMNQNNRGDCTVVEQDAGGCDSPTYRVLPVCVITWRQRRRLLIMLVGDVDGVPKNIMMTSAWFFSVFDNRHKIK